MAERVATPTKVNPDRVKEHAEVLAALSSMREHLGETAAWESIEHAVRTGVLQARIRIPAEDGVR